MQDSKVKNIYKQTKKEPKTIFWDEKKNSTKKEYMSYVVLSVVIVPAGVAGIDLVLEIVECFEYYLNYSGLGGCGVCFLVAVGSCMFF